MEQIGNDLMVNFQDMQKSNENFLKMKRERETLPVFAMRQQILDAVYQNSVVVIKGNTGCGKTTQVSFF